MREIAVVRKRVMIVDDRSCEVPLQLEGAAFDRSNEQDRHDRKELHRELCSFFNEQFGVRRRRWHFVTIPIGMGMCLWSVPQLMQHVFQRSLFATLGWPGIVLIVVVGAAGLLYPLSMRLRMNTLGSGSSFAKKMITRRRCPACLHNLRGRTPDLDGCTVCSECGAAWRLADATCPTDQS